MIDIRRLASVRFLQVWRRLLTTGVWWGDERHAVGTRFTSRVIQAELFVTPYLALIANSETKFRNKQ